MRTLERALGGPEIEAVAKATRRRFTLQYKRKIVREDDRCKSPGAARCCAARVRTPPTWRPGARPASGPISSGRGKRGPAPRVTDSRNRVIAEQAREITEWKHRAERAEALVEIQRQVAALLGTPLDVERS
jgi:transposase